MTGVLCNSRQTRGHCLFVSVTLSPVSRFTARQDDGQSWDLLPHGEVPPQVGHCSGQSEAGPSLWPWHTFCNCSSPQHWGKQQAERGDT
jgi:hypothetical protein